MASKHPFQKTISNNHLGVSKTIKGKSRVELDNKVKVQMEKWKLQVEKLNNKNKEERELLRAEELTIATKELISEYQNILFNSARISHDVNWDSLLIKREFEPFVFNDITPILEEYFKKYKVPSPSFWEEILPFIKRSRLKVENTAKLEYEKDYNLYQEKKEMYYQKYIEEKSLFESTKKVHNETLLKIKNGLIPININLKIGFKSGNKK